MAFKRGAKALAPKYGVWNRASSKPVRASSDACRRRCIYPFQKKENAAARAGLEGAASISRR